MVNEEKVGSGLASPCASLDEKPEVGSEEAGSRSSQRTAQGLQSGGGGGAKCKDLFANNLDALAAPRGFRDHLRGDDDPMEALGVPDVFGQIFEAPVRKTPADGDDPRRAPGVVSPRSLAASSPPDSGRPNSGASSRTGGGDRNGGDQRNGGDRAPRRSASSLPDEAAAARKTSFIDFDGQVESDIKDAELQIEEHLGDAPRDVALTISRHVASSLALSPPNPNGGDENDNSNTNARRVTRISDPLITTDLVRRKSSGVIYDNADPLADDAPF